MYVYHNLRDSFCKYPLGALPLGQSLHLQLYCAGSAAELADLQVTLCYAYGLEKFTVAEQLMYGDTLDYGEQGADCQTAALCGDFKPTSDFYFGTENALKQKHFSQLSATVSTDTELQAHFLTAAQAFRLEAAAAGQKARIFRLEINSIKHAHLFFYYFKLELADGKVLYYNYAQDSSGSGILADYPATYQVEAATKNAFAVNFYTPQYMQQNALTGQLIYQIFPDRFRRDKDFAFTAMCNKRPTAERIYHVSWSEEVDYKGKDGKNYEASDFYGGSLKGICEKLPYLADLGVRFLYLNPIFKARSNHRYDTADYDSVDDLLGDEADLRCLIKEAQAHGIGIILDLVINHCGADSLYFNRYGRYPTIGAAQSQKSPYHKWFYFKQWQEPASQDFSDYQFEDAHYAQPVNCKEVQHLQMARNVRYESWWGFSNLPTFNKANLDWRNFVYGKDGFIRKWLRMGISGYRIDVSDEIPDDVLKELYQAVKEENSDAVIIGEVWENPALQISYGHYRDFALGHTHDSFMGYPFRNVLLAFLRSEISAVAFCNVLAELANLLPEHIFYANMQLLSSHDRPRFITAVMSNEIPKERAQQSKMQLQEGDLRHGQRCLLLASLIQMFYPGAPAVYYGDELAAQGAFDPFNRRTFDWDLQQRLAALQAEMHLDKQIYAKQLPAFKEKYGAEIVDLAVLNQQLQFLYRLRSEQPVLQTGTVKFLYADATKFAFERELKASGARALCAINRSGETWHFNYRGKDYALNTWQGMGIIGDEFYIF